MDSPSSLELFLLAAIAGGCATAYDLHREAGLSVGSTLPALERRPYLARLHGEETVILRSGSPAPR